MKFKATIFVEGEADIRFIECFVKQRFDYELKKGIELQKTNGKDSLHELQINFQENTKQEIVNLVIFDANGHYQNRKAELIQKGRDLSISFEQFLFPNNNELGDLETLLENIVNPVYANMLSCFEQLQKCLAKLEIEDIKIPSKKDKIYMYASLLSSNDLAKEAKRNYLDKKLWNLDSEYLGSLYNFFKPHFVER